MISAAGPSSLVRVHPRSLYSTLARANSSYAGAHALRKSPNSPLDLDPSLRELLNQSGDALSGLKHRAQIRPLNLIELDVIDPVSSGTITVAEEQEEPVERREERKSPAAVFGSQRTGHISIPHELENAVTALIEQTDKYQLRSDAKRLFLHPSSSSPSGMRWQTRLPNTQNANSKDRRMAPREGMAFVSVGMPAQYAAISAVLGEAKHRLEQDWEVREVLDFGSKSGTGLWATQEALGGLEHYVGIDSRAGLTELAQELVKASKRKSSTKLSFVKRWGRDGRALQTTPDKTLVLSAFTLSELKTDINRKNMLRDMWNTGAETIVIIEQGTKEGFQILGNAREYLLRKGRKELASTGPSASAYKLGSHVVAPCPHDGTCPLFSILQHVGDKKPTRLALQTPMGPTPFCHFTQRLERPEFVRLTKHSHNAHEDILYSYVVIRRGTRPTVSANYAGMESSREGAVAKDERSALDEKERMETGGSRVVMENDHGELHFTGDDSTPASLSPIVSENEADETLDELRKEAYEWPRVIYPPMKRSGHVSLDSCTKDGNISRITIPKSQGKQPYYDARKAGWGDIFPHEPKNGLEVRKRPIPGLVKGNAFDIDDEEEEDGFHELMEKMGKDGTLQHIESEVKITEG